MQLEAAKLCGLCYAKESQQSSKLMRRCHMIRSNILSAKTLI